MGKLGENMSNCCVDADSGSTEHAGEWRKWWGPEIQE